jgi:thiamine transporter ThiT
MSICLNTDERCVRYLAKIEGDGIILSIHELNATNGLATVIYSTTMESVYAIPITVIRLVIIAVLQPTIIYTSTATIITTVH